MHADTAILYEATKQHHPFSRLTGGANVLVFPSLDAGNIADSEAVGTGIAFDPRVANQILTFSSISDGRFTDAETGSIWTLLGQAVDGPLSGEQLQTVQHRNEFWFAWASFFPDAPVYAGAQDIGA